MSTVNDVLKNYSRMYLEIRTILGFQEVDEQVSSRRERLPFLHRLLSIPFRSPLCPASPFCLSLRCQSPLGTAVETSCEKLSPSGEFVVSEMKKKLGKAGTARGLHRGGSWVRPGGRCSVALIPCDSSSLPLLSFLWRSKYAFLKSRCP